MLLPAIVSFAPPKRVPLPLRYENKAGDVLWVADLHTKEPRIELAFRTERTECKENFAGSIEHVRGHRYEIDNEYAHVALRITERSVKVIRAEIFAEEGRACDDFAGVYKRVEDD